MKVAVIPSLSVLEYDTGEIHMMLPEPCHREPRYRNYYQGSTDFKILDNGEAEGMRMRPRELMNMAVELGANEVIVPDHLGGMDETIKLARDFAKTAHKYPGFKYMAVAQGRNYGDYINCLRAFSDLDFITTVGLPRNIVRTVGSKWARIVLAEMIESQGFTKRFDLHALGGTNWMREAVCLSELDIRSIDTSLPFVMAWDKRSIQVHEHIDRQPDFFTYEPNHYERELCLDNISAYRDWCGDYPTSSSQARVSQL